MYLDIKYYVISCTVMCACVCVFGPLNFVDTDTVIGLLNFFAKKSLHHILGKQDCIVVHDIVHHMNRK